MIPDVLRVVGPSTQPVRRVLHQQRAEQRFSLYREPGREAQDTLEDLLEELLVLTGVERQPAAHHLVHHHSHTPPVHRAAVVVVLEDFRGQVFGSATEGAGAAGEGDVLFAETEVGDLDVPVLVEQQVLQLEMESHVIEIEKCQ